MSRSDYGLTMSQSRIHTPKGGSRESVDIGRPESPKPVTEKPIIQRVPPEVLAQILDKYVHDHEGRPQGLLRVCRTFYDTIISAPNLWTVIRCPKDVLGDWYEAERLLPYVASHARLSGDLPLEIDLRGATETYNMWRILATRHQGSDFLDVFFGKDGSISRRCWSYAADVLPGEQEIIR